MSRILTFLFLLFFVNSYAQDNYHLELIAAFGEDYSLDAPEYIFLNNETSNLARMYTYGGTTITTKTVDGFDFERQTSFSIPSAGENAWDSGVAIQNIIPISQNDVLVFTFWAKKTSSDSEVKFFMENVTTYDKEIYQDISFTPDWNQYYLAIKVANSYGGSKLAAGFHLGGIAQDFELAGFTGFNFGNIDIESVPSSFSTGDYEGIEEDAPWRAEAAERIENIRKSNLKINVQDINGNPLSDAEVTVEMQEHEFQFGSAFVTCRFQGNRCYNSKYVAKIFDLDGKGHGFNAGVTENAMKWDGWEEEWIGTPDQTIDAIKYLSDNGVKMRGHTLFWPGFDHLPADIQENKNDLDYIRSRMAVRIDEMINNPTLSEVVREWDVFNEITQNRDLEFAFKEDPNFTTGREIYQEIFADIRALDPNLKLYINDYVVLSGGGTSTSVVNRYKEYLDEMHNSDQPFDGIGFQGHIGSTPTSILKIKSVFDDFYERYGTRQSVTEYDISDLVDPEIQAKYIADFLTITFSHPSMDAFIMWGFWDGNHWKGNAPMFDKNWNIKPSGQAFIDKVFGEWWTEETVISDATGLAELRAFRGTHKIIVTKDGESTEMEVVLGDDEEISVVIEGVSSVYNALSNNISVNPNLISEGFFIVNAEKDLQINSIQLVSVNGRIVSKFNSPLVGAKINIDIPAGVYFVKIKTEEGVITKRVLVQ